MNPSLIGKIDETAIETNEISKELNKRTLKQNTKLVHKDQRLTRKDQSNAWRETRAILKDILKLPSTKR